jgi:uroporphyrinogen-III synthase
VSSVAGQPVVVTRAESGGGGLRGELERLGLTALHWPVIGIEWTDAAEWEALRRATATFDWIVFTSAHAVEAVTDTLPRPPARTRIAAVGSSTADLLRERGWRVDLCGPGPGAETLVHALAEVGLRGRRVLYPASSRSRPTLPEGLARLGADVVRFVAYRTVPATLDADSCRTMIRRNAVGAVTFASPSAVTELENILGTEYFQHLFATAPAVSIGPTTARALEARGIPSTVAASATLRGLAHACLAVWHDPQPKGCKDELSLS